MLTTADTNLKIGTAYFADLVQQFGGAHYALATYNAGPGRVARWIAERPGIDRDEFIDDIPFPETQDYVKKILGRAEDYRYLYGGVAESLTVNAPAPNPAARSASPSTASAKPAKAAPKKKPVAPAKRKTRKAA
jgi:soluble lytic murein transglycosylase